ncbi:MAG: group II truncated hemoglobin [Nitrospiraceae bacterium]|nr:group II truncated hemoglobin [Nitrospiraceae bacterium]
MNGYGNDMSPYHAAGELAGVTSLVDAFYSNMDTFPEACVIRKMHPEDLTEARKKLTYFLCGVLGGPRLYIDHYGPVNLPDFHRKFPIGTEERDAWMLCMQHAIAVQPYEISFKEFLLARLWVPAERIRMVNTIQTSQLRSPRKRQDFRASRSENVHEPSDFLAV